MSVEWTVKNSGEASTRAAWVDRVYFTTDGVPSTGVKLAEVARDKALTRDELYTTSAEVVLPDRPDGDYRIVVVTDALNQVFEQSRDDNNTGEAPLALIHPDLTVVSLTAPSTAVVSKFCRKSFGACLSRTRACATPAWSACPTNGLDRYRSRRSKSRPECLRRP